MQINSLYKIENIQLSKQSKAKNNCSSNNFVDKNCFEGAQILAKQNIAFMSKKDPKQLSFFEYDNFSQIEENEDNVFWLLKNNPDQFYVQNGLHINNYLRTGKLLDMLEIKDTDPENFREILEEVNNRNSMINSAIVNSIEILDNKMTARTKNPMIVYRYAPTSWLKTAKDGIVEDKGFFSTTIIPGSTLEAFTGHEPKSCFKVFVPENTPYIDLIDYGENELLFPRNLKFKIEDNEHLTMLNDKQ